MIHYWVRILFLLPITALMLLGCTDKNVQAGQQADTVRNVDQQATMVEVGATPEKLVNNDKEPDLERLLRIQDRLRKAGLAGYAVIFGTVDQSSQSMVAVDYALFDQLSDDAVACMVAEAMLGQSSLLKKLAQTADPQNQKLSNSDFLEIDFKTGLHLAGAGFSPDGFGEWLEIKKMSANPEQVIPLADSHRRMWFMRGYREISAESIQIER